MNKLLMTKLLTLLIILNFSLWANNITNVVEKYDNSSPKVVHYSKKNQGKLDIYKIEYFYDNGQLHIEKNYLNQKLDGNYYEYYWDGNLKIKTKYKNDKLNGFYEQYSKDAVLLKKGVYKDDQKNGIWRYFYTDGSDSTTCTFRKNELLREVKSQRTKKYEIDKIEQVFDDKFNLIIEYRTSSGKFDEDFSSDSIAYIEINKLKGYFEDYIKYFPENPEGYVALAESYILGKHLNINSSVDDMTSFQFANKVTNLLYSAIKMNSHYQDKFRYAMFPPNIKIYHEWSHLALKYKIENKLDSMSFVYKNMNEMGVTNDSFGRFIHDYAYNFLNSCEPNSILFTNGDNDTFPLWYLQEVENIRTDVCVVNLSLLNTPWYINHLKNQGHKLPFSLSDEAINLIEPINATAYALNLWTSEIDDMTTKLQDRGIKYDISKYGILPWKQTNTSIKCLHESYEDKNNNGVYDFGEVFTDYNNNGVRDHAKEINFKLNPTISDAYLRVQDVMILQLINDMPIDRPIYFAFTVSPNSMLGLDKYIEMQGHVYKFTGKENLDPSGSPQLNLQKTIQFISETNDYDNHIETSDDYIKAINENKGIYRYRNLNNEEVYFSKDIIQLAQNFRSPFLQSAQELIYQDQLDEANDILLSMDKSIPINTIPILHSDYQLTVARLFAMAGNKDKFNFYMQDLMNRDDLTIQDHYDISSVLLMDSHTINEGEEYVKKRIQNYPNKWEFSRMLVVHLGQNSRYQEAIDIIKNWISLNDNFSQPEAYEEAQGWLKLLYGESLSDHPIPINEDEEFPDATYEEFEIVFENWEDWDAPPPQKYKNDPEFIPYDQAPMPKKGKSIFDFLVYPKLAIEMKLEGKVFIKFFVDKNGKVRANSVHMIRGNPVFEVAAITAVIKSEWIPARQRDMRVGVYMTVPVNFNLKDAQ